MQAERSPNSFEFNGLPNEAAALAVWPDDPTEKSGAFASPLTVSTILPGPRYIAFYMLALPVFVTALASSGIPQLVSGLIAITWLALTPLALFSRGAALLLPIASAVFLVLAALLLTFGSAAFVVDVTATALMFLVSFPHQRAQRLVHQPSAS